MVVGATGHQDIPTAALAAIRGGIEKALGRVAKPLEGVSSLAEGADQLFAELVLREGGRLRAVIPSPRYEETFTADGLHRYRALLEAAADVETLDYPAPSEEAYLAAGKRVVDLSDRLIAVWDGQAARGLGGTADIVTYAHQTRKAVEVIWPEGVHR